MTAPNPQGQFGPLPTVDGRYRMGPLFTETPDIDFWFNTELADGTMTAATEPDGWEGITHITPVDQVGGRDGGLTGPSSIAPRIIEVEGAMVAPTAELLRRNIRRIRRILGVQRPRQPVIWEQHDWDTGMRWALLTRPLGDARFPPVPGHHEGGVACQIRFQLIAANPVWKYLSGEAQSNEVGLLNPSLVQGRTYDKSYSYTYGAATSIGGEMEVVNYGDVDAWPVFTVIGEADFPIISNATTGREFAVNKNLASLETVVVESRTGNVTPASVRLVGRPFPLTPGSNTIRWRTVSGAFHPEALLRLEWRSTSS